MGMVNTEKGVASMFGTHPIYQALDTGIHSMAKFTLALMAALLLALPAFAQQKDIVDTSVSAGNFNTLATALTKAVDRGAPMLNAHNHAACSAVYEFYGDVLLSLPADEVNETAKNNVQKAMRLASQSHDASERAWIIRRAFDQMSLAARN